MLRKSANDIKSLKRKNPIVCLTAYTAPIARAIDEQVDLMLVGDSLGMVLYDYENTLQVTLEQMIKHAKSVVRASNTALPIPVLYFASLRLPVMELPINKLFEKLAPPDITSESPLSSVAPLTNAVPLFKRLPVKSISPITFNDGSLSSGLVLELIATFFSNFT